MPAHHPSLTAERLRRYTPSIWDLAVFTLVIGSLSLIAVGGRETLQPLAAANQRPVSLDPLMLPHYALRTTMRMLAAMAFSVLFTFVYGAVAAKSRRAETVLIPLLDVLQSVPVLGFLSFTVTGFMALFPGSVLGVECAAIFAIFTSQAWNMAFSFYYSLKTVPRDLRDVSDSLRLGAWRRFWTLEAPFAAPGLIWNAMMSMSGAWFFVVASEAISVGKTVVTLPGVGSYVAQAIAAHDLRAIGWAVLTMAVVILIYDQLLFRPLVAWAEKFRVEQTASASAPPGSWLLDFLQRAQLARRVFRPLGRVVKLATRARLEVKVGAPPAVGRALESRWADRAWLALLAGAAVLALIAVVRYLGATLTWRDLGWATWLGFLTLVRVIVLIALASLFWTPIGVLIGMRPKLAEAVQPIAQFMAAFPSNLLFPLVVVGIVRFHLTPDVWLSPLMILGTQWYILFNVIAGASVFPNDLQEAAASFKVRGWQWWRKVALPGVFPSYVTGALTASGGAWNAAIVAEVASWGSTKLTAHGLGAYIADATTRGDFRQVTLGVAVMAVFVVSLNRYFWRPMFAFGSRKLGLD